MSLELLGPVILDIEGLSLSEEDIEILQHPQVGGVIFFSRNYQEPAQIQEVVKHIRSLRKNLLLCVDQEGGRVQRFIKGLTRLPSVGILGELIDNQQFSADQISIMSEQLGALMALEIRSLGIDLSFAPVLDLNIGLSEVIGNRAFHHDPHVVVSVARAYIKGMNSVGMKAVGKHFPGHGSTAIDSHLSLPIDNRTLKELAVDLLPFQTFIRENIAGIMPAHILYPNIDENPVGFSSYWLQEILKGQLKYQGTIVSDDLSMEGAVSIGTYVQRAQKALKAGCDYVLICNNRAGAMMALEGLTQPVMQEDSQKREGLLAKGKVAPYSQLMESEEWENAYEVIETLMQIQNN